MDKKDITISIIVTVGNERHTPEGRGDCWREALECYQDLADEVIVVSGNKHFKAEGQKIRNIYLKWPWEWSWEELPLHLNVGLEAATGDFVIRSDIDYIFHEQDHSNIKNTLRDLQQYPILSMQKNVFVTKDRYYQKGRVPLVINKKLVNDEVKFGHATNADTDLCYPILVTGKNKKGVPEGTYPEDKFQARTRQPFYVYDYSFKTKEVAMEEFWRFSKARHRYFGDWSWGRTKEKSFEKFMKMMQGRSKRCVYKIGQKTNPRSIKYQSKYMVERMENIKPEEFAYDMWKTINLLEG